MTPSSTLNLNWTSTRVEYQNIPILRATCNSQLLVWTCASKCLRMTAHNNGCQDPRADAKSLSLHSCGQLDTATTSSRQLLQRHGPSMSMSDWNEPAVYSAARRMILTRCFQTAGSKPHTDISCFLASGTAMQNAGASTCHVQQLKRCLPGLVQN